MAAVTRARKIQQTSPANERYNIPVRVFEDVLAGEQLVQRASDGQYGKAPLGELEADGMACDDAFAGQDGVSMCKIGEFDGFSGLTPRARLYPAPAGGAAGGLDTTQPAGAVARVKAIAADKIFVNYL